MTQHDLVTFALVKLLVLHHYLKAKKKACLKAGVICAALGRLRWSLWK